MTKTTQKMPWLWPTTCVILLIVIGSMVASGSKAFPSPPTHVPANAHILIMRATEMFCAGCEWSVEDALQSTPGIHSANANIDTKEVEIVYDPNVVTRDQIIAQGIFDTYGREFVSNGIYSP